MQAGLSRKYFACSTGCANEAYGKISFYLVNLMSGKLEGSFLFTFFFSIFSLNLDIYRCKAGCFGLVTVS